MSFCWLIKKLDMEANKPSQGLYPLHRCKTIHLVRCFLFLFSDLALFLQISDWALLCLLGEACSRDSQCWRREEPWRLLIWGSLWCTSHTTRMATGTVFFGFCYLDFAFIIVLVTVIMYIMILWMIGCCDVTHKGLICALFAKGK